MKKNLYYRMYLERKTASTIIMPLFISLAAIPRMLLEVFIRKGFGERYFSFTQAVLTALVLAGWPLVPIQLGGHFLRRTEPSLLPYITWYVFLAGFLFFVIKHGRDQKRTPGVFDFKKYSRYQGKIHPYFFTLQFPGRKTDVRLVECWLEPAGFFFLGVFFALIGQALGGLLIACSIFYALSYQLAYLQGDHFVMDRIDEMIVNEELEKAFMEDQTEDDTRGFRFVGRKPTDENLRRRVFDAMTADDKIFEAK